MQLDMVSCGALFVAYAAVGEIFLVSTDDFHPDFIHRHKVDTEDMGRDSLTACKIFVTDATQRLYVGLWLLMRSFAFAKELSLLLCLLIF